MKPALLMITDGRTPCFRATVDSAKEHLGFENFSRFVVINDSTDGLYSEWLHEGYGSIAEIHDIALPPNGKQGFSGAIQAGWKVLDDHDGSVFHLEDDFEFHEHVPLGEMQIILDCIPKLAQVAFVRNPVSASEIWNGGLIQANYEHMHMIEDPYPIMTHNRWFTTNPCLYPNWLLRGYSWPDPPHSEAAFGNILVRDGFRFAYWGRPDDKPFVNHTGIRTKDWKL